MCRKFYITIVAALYIILSGDVLCEVETITKLEYADSPFGFLTGAEHEHFIDIGARWVRMGFAGGDDNIEDYGEKVDEKGDEVFLEPENYRGFDRIPCGSSGVNVILTTNPTNRGYPKDVELWKMALKFMIERYDGDGIDDAPGHPVITYFQFCNEPDLSIMIPEETWSDTTTNYARTLAITYDTIKKAQPKAKILLGGLTDPHPESKDSYSRKFLTEVLEELKEIDPDRQFFDYLDWHFYLFDSGESYRVMDTGLAAFKEILDNYGYSDVEFICVETGTYSDWPLSGKALREAREKMAEGPSPWESEASEGQEMAEERERDEMIEGEEMIVEDDKEEEAENRLKSYHSEAYQAAWLVKTYVYGIYKGFDKICWASLTEFGGYGGGYFDHFGLINRPYLDDETSKKKAYFTYKLMTSKLEGSDWDLTKEIAVEFDGKARCFKFVNDGNPIFIAWSDEYVPAAGKIPFEFDEAKITVMIPDSQEYKFPEREWESKNGKLDVPLGWEPVLIEPVK